MREITFWGVRRPDDNSRSLLLLLLQLMLQVYDHNGLLHGGMSCLGDLRESQAPRLACDRRGRSEAAGNANINPRTGRETLRRVGFRRSCSRRVDIADFPATISGNWDAGGVALGSCGFRVPALSCCVQTVSDQLANVACVEKTGPRSARRHG